MNTTACGTLGDPARHSTSRSRLGALLPILLAAACQTDAGANPGVEVADSAGVPVVLNRPSVDSMAVWRIAATPTLELGLADGPPSGGRNHPRRHRAAPARVAVARPR